MRLTYALCSILVLTLLPIRSFAQRPLEGCVRPDKIRALLAEIHDSDWQGVSLQRVRSMWPTELADIQYDSDTTGSVTSQDRIIKGNCQCCVVFEFKLQRSQAQPRNEQLSGIIINYSAPRRIDLIGIARALAGATGVKRADLKTIGADSRQSFQWETTKGNQRSVFILEIHFSHESPLWKLYFSIGRHVIDSQP